MNSDRPLVSIIIPCFNQLSCTQLCVESVSRHTPVPYELIIIDNGSRDGTQRYLREITRTIKRVPTPPVRYLPIINPVNAGVASALNQGIRHSRGTAVCYVNNDTIVTGTWLASMLSCAQRDTRIGIVGCATNLVCAAREGFPRREGLRNVQEIQRTGSLIEMVNAGRSERAPFVHGFCMLITREVVRAVGLFDESFYPCAGEDIDYSFRARRAGFLLRNALDAFVFHFWGRATCSPDFNALYSDIEAVKMNAASMFIKKWGAAGERYLKEARTHYISSDISAPLRGISAVKNGKIIR